MRKGLIALATAAALAAGTLSAPTTAVAGSRSGAVAAGIIGGAAAGLLLGSAIANSQPRYYGPQYAPAPGYVIYNSYYQDEPIDCPGGYWARRPTAFDHYGSPVRWSRPRYFCP